MVNKINYAMARAAIVLAFLVPSLISGQANAQCTPSGVSNSGQVSCSTTISLTIPALISVTNVSTTLDLGTFDGVNNLSAADNSVCVWTNTGQYYVTASGNGTGSALTLQGQTSGNSDEVAYSVTWYDATNLGGTGTTLLSGIKSSAIGNVGSNPNCTGGDVASFRVAVAGSAAAAASKDTYAGVLTLVFEPE